MFRKFLIFAMFATACGYVFASDGVVVDQEIRPTQNTETYVFDGYGASNEVYSDDGENVRIVSKIGEDLVVENNFNMAGFAGGRVGEGWSGGADLTHPYQAPAGFNIFESQAEMPLMHSEMLEDDGGAVLSISRSDRKKAGREVAQKFGTVDGVAVSGEDVVSGEFFGNDMAYVAGGAMLDDCEDVALDDCEFEVEEVGAVTKASISGEPVRSWIVASGQTLRSVLQEWCDKEGWDLVWGTAREYPIAASAVFKGRFMDVASALVRNFSRANPIPYAKFYKGNRVLVITTTEE